MSNLHKSRCQTEKERGHPINYAVKIAIGSRDNNKLDVLIAVPTQCDFNANDRQIMQISSCLPKKVPLDVDVPGEDALFTFIIRSPNLSPAASAELPSSTLLT